MTPISADLIMALRHATGLPVSQAKSFIEENSSELIERIILAGESKEKYVALNDPIELDPKLGPVIKRVLKESEKIVFKDNDGEYRRGMCHQIWKVAQAKLKDEHDLIWYSPREMNPGIWFD